MPKLLLLAAGIAAGCATPSAATPANRAPTTPDTVLRWSSNGDAFGFDEVVRHRLEMLALRDVTVVFRGTTLEVTVPNPTAERRTLIQGLVEKPYHVDLAAGTATFPLDKTTLADCTPGYDSVTNRPQLELAVVPASTQALAEFTAHATKLSIVADGETLLADIQSSAPIEHGKLVILPSERDATAAEHKRDDLALAIRAAKAGPLTRVSAPRISH
jgi:hypothetical protein